MRKENQQLRIDRVNAMNRADTAERELHRLRKELNDKSECALVDVSHCCKDCDYRYVRYKKSGKIDFFRCQKFNFYTVKPDFYCGFFCKVRV